MPIVRTLPSLGAERCAAVQIGGHDHNIAESRIRVIRDAMTAWLEEVQPQHRAQIVVDIDAKAGSPVAVRADVIIGELHRHTQRLGGDGARLVLCGATHHGNTGEEARDAALRDAAGFPWVLALLHPDLADAARELRVAFIQRLTKSAKETP